MKQRRGFIMGVLSLWATLSTAAAMLAGLPGAIVITSIFAGASLLLLALKYG